MDRFSRKVLRITEFSLAFGLSCLIVTTGAHATAIVSGFDSNIVSRNDDGSEGPVNIGFTANFFGIEHSELYVNNNGNITFGSPLSTFTPFDLTSTGQQIIAPFFADVDTRNAGDPVTYGSGTYGGRDAFGVNWINVDYYASSTTHTNRNSFQLILVDRSDVASGDFDFIFNYDQIEWETGQASEGDTDGLGGNSARVGYSNGTGNPGTSFELPGSATNGAFLDGGANALITNRLNSDIDGRYVFSARNGGVEDPGNGSGDNPVQVPEPGTLALLGIGLAGLGLARRRRAC